MLYLHTTFHMPGSSDSLVITIKTMENCHVTANLLFYVTKSSEVSLSTP